VLKPQTKSWWHWPAPGHCLWLTNLLILETKLEGKEKCQMWLEKLNCWLTCRQKRKGWNNVKKIVILVFVCLFVCFVLFLSFFFVFNFKTFRFSLFEEKKSFFLYFGFLKKDWKATLLEIKKLFFYFFFSRSYRRQNSHLFLA